MLVHTQSAPLDSNHIFAKRNSDDTGHSNGSSSTTDKDREKDKIDRPRLGKRRGLSAFVNSVLGSPKTGGLKISDPKNPVHVHHVGFNIETGKFTVGWLVAAMLSDIIWAEQWLWPNIGCL
jgi:P21-Rho-binding domain